MKVNLPGADDSVRCILHMQAFFHAVLPIGHPITSFLAEHYQVMKAFDPGKAHHETSNPLLSSLTGVYHLQWLSLHLAQYFKSQLMWLSGRPMLLVAEVRGSIPAKHRGWSRR